MTSSLYPVGTTQEMCQEMVDTFHQQRNTEICVVRCEQTTQYTAVVKTSCTHLQSLDNTHLKEYTQTCGSEKDEGVGGRVDK